MRFGICKECFADVPLDTTTLVGDEIYECPKCDYPNGVRCGDFWEIWEK